MNEDRTRVAILDMNNGVSNQGLRCIKEIVGSFEYEVEWKIFDVRQHGEIPDLSYDIYICSGGPGSPIESGEWRENFLDLIDLAWAHNLSTSFHKKYFFFICYSFQVACHHFELGDITRRRSTSFGVLPVHKTPAGKKDNLLAVLPDPYYAVDSRDWQLVQPRLEVFEEHSASILSLEKIRTHVEYERAIMAVRFSEEFIGTQFHPEADPEGMKAHFSKLENKEAVTRNFGEEKYKDMMEHLEDPDKIAMTHQQILPRFISGAIMMKDELQLEYR